MMMKIRHILLFLLVVVSLSGCFYESKNTDTKEPAEEVSEILPGRELSALEVQTLNKMVDVLTLNTETLESIDVASQLEANANIDKEIVRNLYLEGFWQGSINTEFDDIQLKTQYVSGVVSADGIVSLRLLSNSLPYYFSLSQITTDVIDATPSSAPVSIEGVFTVSNIYNTPVAEYSFVGIKQGDTLSGVLANGISLVTDSDVVGAYFVEDNRYIGFSMNRYESNVDNSPAYLKQNEDSIISAAFNTSIENNKAPVYLLDENGAYSFEVNGCVVVGYISPSNGVMQFAGKSTPECMIEIEVQGILYIDNHQTLMLEYFLDQRRFTVQIELNQGATDQ